MTISFKRVFNQKAAGERKPEGLVKAKDLLLSFLKNKNQFKPENIHWKSDDEVEVDQLEGLSLHTFLLKAEELGLNVEYEKKTIIRLR